MNLYTLYSLNLDWDSQSKIEVTVEGEEKGEMTFEQALLKYEYLRVVGFNKTQVWLGV